MAKTSKNKIKTTNESHYLKCELTQDELLNKGESLAHSLDSLNRLADEKKAVSDQLKAQEAKLQAEITVLQQAVRNRFEIRFIECTLCLNYTSQQATLTRKDTDKLVSDRKLTEEEKQMDMGFDKEEAA